MQFAGQAISLGYDPTTDSASFTVVNGGSAAANSTGIAPAHPAVSAAGGFFTAGEVGPPASGPISNGVAREEGLTLPAAAAGIVRGDESPVQAAPPVWARIAQDEMPAEPAAGGLIDPTPRLNDPVRLLAVVDVRAEPPASLTAPTGAPQENGQVATPLDGIDGARGRSQAFDLAAERHGPDLGPSAAAEKVVATARVSSGHVSESAQPENSLALATTEDLARIEGSKVLPLVPADRVAPAVSVASQPVVSYPAGGISWEALLREARIDNHQARTVLSAAAVAVVSWELSAKRLQNDRPQATHEAGWKIPRREKEA
jgi:hypothetical protein